MTDDQRIRACRAIVLLALVAGLAFVVAPSHVTRLRAVDLTAAPGGLRVTASEEEALCLFGSDPGQSLDRDGGLSAPEILIERLSRLSACEQERAWRRERAMWVLSGALVAVLVLMPLRPGAGRRPEEAQTYDGVRSP